MPDSEILGFTEDTSPLGTDIFYVQHNPAGTPADRKVTLKTVLRHKHVELASGDITTSSTTFVALTGAQVSINANIGDTIRARFMAVSTNSSATLGNGFDFATWVSGAIQNRFANCADGAVRTWDNNIRPALMEWDYEVVSGDLVGGVVTVQVVWRVLLASTGTVLADGTNRKAQLAVTNMSLPS